MRWSVPALVVFAFVSCAVESGSGRVVGSLLIPDCVDGKALDFTCNAGDLDQCEAFDLDPDFFALETTGDIAVLRIQKGGQPFARTNGLLFQIRDVRQLRGNLGIPLPVGPDANIRAALGLFELCPGSTQNFELLGTIVFDKFGVDTEDFVRGSFDPARAPPGGLEVRDGRGTGRVLGRLRGDFDFEVVKGPPHQQFTGN